MAQYTIHCWNDSFNRCMESTESFASDRDFRDWLSRRPNCHATQQECEAAHAPAPAPKSHHDHYKFINGSVVKRDYYDTDAAFREFLRTHPDNFASADDCRAAGAGKGAVTPFVLMEQCECRSKNFHGTLEQFNAFITGHPDAYYNVTECNANKPSSFEYWKCENDLPKRVGVSPSGFGCRQTDFLAWLQNQRTAYKREYFPTQSECAAYCSSGERRWEGYRCLGEDTDIQNAGCATTNFKGTEQEWLDLKARQGFTDTAAKCGETCHVYWERAENDIVCARRAFRGTLQDFNLFMSPGGPPGSERRFRTQKECEDSSILRYVWYNCIDGTCVRFEGETYDPAVVENHFRTPGNFKTEDECRAVCGGQGGVVGEHEYWDSSSGACEKKTYTGTLEQFTALLSVPSNHATQFACEMALKMGDNWYDNGRGGFFGGGWYLGKFLFTLLSKIFGGLGR